MKLFSNGIVVGIAFPAHADRDPVLLQPIGVVTASMLHAAITVMDQLRRGGGAVAPSGPSSAVDDR